MAAATIYVCVRARARTRCGVFSVAHLNYDYPCKPRAESSGGSEPSATVCLPCTRAGRAGCAAVVSVAETVHGRSVEGLSEGGAQNRGVNDAARWLSIVCEAIAWCGVVRCGHTAAGRVVGRTLPRCQACTRHCHSRHDCCVSMSSTTGQMYLRRRQGTGRRSDVPRSAP